MDSILKQLKSNDSLDPVHSHTKKFRNITLKLSSSEEKALLHQKKNQCRYERLKQVKQQEHEYAHNLAKGFRYKQYRKKCQHLSKIKSEYEQKQHELIEQTEQDIHSFNQYFGLAYQQADDLRYQQKYQSQHDEIKEQDKKKKTIERENRALSLIREQQFEKQKSILNFQKNREKAKYKDKENRQRTLKETQKILEKIPPNLRNTPNENKIILYEEGTCWKQSFTPTSFEKYDKTNLEKKGDPIISSLPTDSNSNPQIQLEKEQREYKRGKMAMKIEKIKKENLQTQSLLEDIYQQQRQSKIKKSQFLNNISEDSTYNQQQLEHIYLSKLPHFISNIHYPNTFSSTSSSISPVTRNYPHRIKMAAQDMVYHHQPFSSPSLNTSIISNQWLTNLFQDIEDGNETTPTDFKDSNNLSSDQKDIPIFLEKDENNIKSLVRNLSL